MTSIKKATPLSTMSLAAFLTWKQYDILVVLEETPGLSASGVAIVLAEVVKFDIKHGGAFYTGISSPTVHGSLRTLERRNLVRASRDDRGRYKWYTSARGKKALRSLEARIDQIA